MKRIGLLSDTHGSLPAGYADFFEPCSEIWHAGDIGHANVADELAAFRPLRAVFGNIDGTDIRAQFHETQIFTVEQLRVVMIHIGGYPGKYTREAFHLIKSESPGLFVSGHSHILKVMYDQPNGLLHINPGAAGKSGLHRKITMVRFVVDAKEIRDLEVFEKDR
ncbi:MAG: metallophosphoesterase family protein [Bacteroidales bacterium]